MAMSVADISQYPKDKKNVVGVDHDDESKEFQNLSLTDRPKPKSADADDDAYGGDSDHKTVAALFDHDYLSYSHPTSCSCHAGPTLYYYSPNFDEYIKRSQPKVLLVSDKKPDPPRLDYSPSPPDWICKETWSYQDRQSRGLSG